MGKSVYSLVLSAEVVAAIDEMAVRKGKSRSALVNHILAEYASLSTPEKRMHEMVKVVEKTARDGGFRTSISDGGILTLRTALRYRYNPAVSYRLEMPPNAASVGSLRIGLRTQNELLQAQLQQFFALWSQLERKNLPQPPPQKPYDGALQKYVRVLRRSSVLQSEQQAGQAIAAYVNLLDDCLKTFFDYAASSEAAANAASKLYLQALPAMGFALEL